MSGKATGMVWELDLDHAQLWILQAMADHADHEGANIFPSIGLIAWKTGYSERQVQRIIKSLLEIKVLELEETDHGKYHTNLYRIRWDNAPKKTPYKSSDRGVKMSPGGVSKCHRGGDILTGRGDIWVSPEPSIEPSINPAPDELAPAKTEPPQKPEPSKKEPTYSSEVKNALAITVYGSVDAWKMHAPQLQQTLRECSKIKPVTLEDLRLFYVNWKKLDFRGQKGQRPTLPQVREMWLQYTVPPSPEASPDDRILIRCDDEYGSGKMEALIKRSALPEYAHLHPEVIR